MNSRKVLTPKFTWKDDAEGNTDDVLYQFPSLPETGQTHQQVQQILRGYPNREITKVCFLEPITIREWVIAFQEKEPMCKSETWKIVTENSTEKFIKDRNTVTLHKPISGKNFEFHMSHVPSSAKVSIKITRGLTVIDSLLADHVLDCTFFVGGKQIRANSHLLAARSEVMKITLFGVMKEAQTKEVHITDVSYEAVSTFVKYMMHDSFTPTEDARTLVEIFQIAHRYMVPVIQDEVLHRIFDVITSKNVLEVMQLAHHCKATPIVKGILEILLHNDFQDYAAPLASIFV